MVFEEVEMCRLIDRYNVCCILREFIFIFLTDLKKGSQIDLYVMLVCDYLAFSRTDLYAVFSIVFFRCRRRDLA